MLKQNHRNTRKIILILFLPGRHMSRKAMFLNALRGEKTPVPVWAEMHIDENLK